MTLISCKETFLEEKPNKAILVPTTIQDAQALMDNTAVMNQVPLLGELSADNYYSIDNTLTGSMLIKNFYTWEKELFNGVSGLNDWNISYSQVFYANVALDALNKITPSASNLSSYNMAKGSALFFRALAFYGLAEGFCVPYNKTSAKTDAGLIIRLSSDVNERPGRSSVEASYDQIINDVTAAIDLLPAVISFKSRPSKAAAQALLARVYLAMEMYNEAEEHASKALEISGKLMDYNTLNPALARPFPVALPNANDEVIFYTPFISIAFLISDLNTIIDSTLYNSYDKNDLRKTLYFNDRGKGLINYKGSYSGSTALFGGLATDELLLIKAEAQARLNKTLEAMTTINTLMIKRWKSGTFIPKIAANPTDALAYILKERRKELIFRGLRWPDLRRLNKDPLTATTLVRVYNGVRFELPPNDNRYTFYLPLNEINDQVQQNVR